MIKYNIIDIFAGCGGLLDGFMQSKHYNPVASIEWEKAPINTLANRLATKWGINDTEESCIRFDIQRIEELFNGFIDDDNYGSNKGLDKIVGDKTIDLIIGGPPCQAYSVAGRIRDKDKMKDDYRNYLFEYYLKIVDRYKPKAFVFENVPGMLSAMPDGTPITELIERDIQNKGYEIIHDISKYALIDTSEYGVPQQRRRVILVGLNKEYFGNNIQEILIDFYTNILPQYKETKQSVQDAIGDLPACYPNDNYIISKIGARKISHSIPKCEITWHVPRFHNERDIKIFKMLAEDIENQEYQYTNADKLNEIYNNLTGANSKVHKYHVLRKELPSTTILAHLYKDGLRFIHYDSSQARSITVREAARLQSFDDDFDFLGSQGDAYKMIGNAVPPKFAKHLSNALYNLMNMYFE